MATSGEQSDLIVGIVGDRNSLANTNLATTQDLIVQARAAIVASVEAYQAVGWSVSVAGVDTTYIPPTASAPTIPDPDDIAISDLLWDQMFVRAQELTDRVAQKNEDAAISAAAWRGHSQWDESVAANTASSEDDSDAEYSINALTSATEQAKAKREDVIALSRVNTELFSAQWSVQIDSENARLNFERLELDKNLEPEKGRTNSELSALEMGQKNANAELVDLIQTYAQLTNGLYQTSDVGLSSSVGISTSPRVYNPSSGDVIWYPL